MSVVGGFLDAHRLVVDAGYGPDVDWAESLAHVKPDAHYVTAEGAWVILNSGFRYAVAQKLWPGIRVAFHELVPQLVDDWNREAALAILNYPKKIDAMIALARIVCSEGVEQILADAKDPPKLARLPFIGKITCWHFAKVLGVDVVKPDVHLMRAAAAAGYDGPDGPRALCAAIGEKTGDRLTVVDSVLWRYGEQRLARGWADWPALWGGP